MTALGGGGPGRSGPPGPPKTPAPSPNRHSTALGSARTVTVSPTREAVNCSALGPGSSQNQEAAPVSPANRGDFWMRPVASVSLSATDAAIASGFRPGPPGLPPGPTSV